MSKFLSKRLTSIKPYRLVTSKSFKLEEQGEEINKLNWNEGFLDILNFKKFNRYINPDLTVANEQAKKIFSSYQQFECRIFPGTDFAHIEALRTFLDKGDRLLINAPTYDNFRCTAESFGAEISFTDFLCTKNDELANQIEKYNPKILYLCNPNNPTGDQIRDLDVLFKKFNNVLFFVDEAYMDFSSVQHFPINRDNILIFKTFSKAFSLAGVRLGLIFTSQSLCSDLDLIYNPKHNSIQAIEFLNTCILQKEQINDYINKIIENRFYFSETLRKDFSDKMYVRESHGNFIFIQFYDNSNAKRIQIMLEDANIFVRLFEDFHGITGIRITIPPEKKILDKIKSILINFFDEENE